MRSFSGGGGSSMRSFSGGGGSSTRSFTGGGGNSMRSFSGGNPGTSFRSFSGGGSAAGGISGGTGGFSARSFRGGDSMSSQAGFTARHAFSNPSSQALTGGANSGKGRSNFSQTQANLSSGQTGFSRQSLDRAGFNSRSLSSGNFDRAAFSRGGGPGNNFQSQFLAHHSQGGNWNKPGGPGGPGGKPNSNWQSNSNWSGNWNGGKGNWNNWNGGKGNWNNWNGNNWWNSGNWHGGNWNGHFGRSNFFFGFGFPFWSWYWPTYSWWWPYGGFGYGLNSWGWPYYGYNSICAYPAYGGYGYQTTLAYAPTDAAAQQPVAAEKQAAPELAGDATSAQRFAAEGELDFKTGDYEGAVHAWRHAIVDDPDNGTLVMMMAQALFATGKFDEAAGAVQQGMAMLPADQWGVVVGNYSELYSNIGDYTNQLRALEKAVKEKPDSPALRFLVGYHYGYLGYPEDALRQLTKAKDLAPLDQMTTKLYEAMEAKLKKPTTEKPTPAVEKPAAAKSASGGLF